MKSLLYSLAFLLLTAVMTGCTIDQLNSVEPSNWQKHEFEKSVRDAVRKAVQSPGIDNGTTLVVTSAGDTLIAPLDSVMRATPNRTVYVEIQSPEYPRGLSSNTLELFTVTGVVIMICIIILIVILMVFITVLRRQGSRSKIISKAIDSSYPLPESFYTGQPKPATVKVTQLFQRKIRETVAGDNATVTVEKEGSETVREEEKVMDENLKEGLSLTSDYATPDKIKNLRNSFILIGLGIVLFISFAAGGNPDVGFFVGGTCLVIGASKLLTYYLSKKL